MTQYKKNNRHHWYVHGPRLLEALEQVLHELHTSDSALVKWARKRVQEAKEM